MIVCQKCKIEHNRADVMLIDNKFVCRFCISDFMEEKPTKLDLFLKQLYYEYEQSKGKMK